jgi:hypothetical protein
MLQHLAASVVSDGGADAKLPDSHRGVLFRGQLDQRFARAMSAKLGLDPRAG